LGCAGNGQTVNNEETYQCWASWSNVAVSSIGANVGGTVTEYITLAGPLAGASTTQIWYPPPGCSLEVVQGASFSWQPLSGIQYQGYVEWPVVLSPVCQGSGNGPQTQFAFFNTWNPPEIPLTWLFAKGGTNTLAPLEPLYIKAWNEYVSMWLSESGFMLDLLLLMALILPILVRPGLRRIRVT
jgi:hypothetical protein